MGLNLPVILHNQPPLATLIWKILLIFLNTVNRPFYLKIVLPNLDHGIFLKEFGLVVFHKLCIRTLVDRTTIEGNSSLGYHFVI